MRGAFHALCNSVLTTCAKIDHSWKSQYSTTTASSPRTTISNESRFDSAFSETTSGSSHVPSNVHFESVERSSRTGSRQTQHASPAAPTLFTRALAKMESAGTRIIAARLSEEWEGLDHDCVSASHTKQADSVTCQRTPRPQSAGRSEADTESSWLVRYDQCLCT
jgi:hypothetical protein